MHDVCSAIHPLAAASPFFRELPLAEMGAELVHPTLPVAHPLGGGRAASLDRDLRATSAALGSDARAYERLLGPLLAPEPDIVADLLRPIRVPRHLVQTASFGLRFGFSSASRLARRFEHDEARALVAGLAGHSMLTLDSPPTAALAVMFALVAHTHGWPLVKGGSQKLADALARLFRESGGEIRTGSPIARIAELPPSKVVLCDVTPRQLAAMAADELPGRFVAALRRYRYGPGVWKIDWALSEPVPWSSDAARRAGTVHVGGTFEEIAASEREVAGGRHPEQPFVLVAQQSLFDERAPGGGHTLWGYCHVPNGSDVDMTQRIEAQIERFAPGFKDVVLDRHATGPAAMERYNANYVGGDINGGMQTLRQFFARPVARWDPYSTPNDRLFICSSSTPPGGGVHGMCGYNAAHVAVKRLRGS